jgi:hypothetical protein
MPTGSAPGRRRRSRSPTGSTCGRTWPRPSRSASPPTAPAWPTPSRPPRAARSRRPPWQRTPTRRIRRGSSPSAPSASTNWSTPCGPKGAACGIARHLGWGLHTVQRYDRAATWQELADGRWQAPRASKLDPFKPYLDQHHDGGHGSITRLFREIRALGYDRSYPVVRDYLSGHQPARAPLPPAPPTVRDVTNWLTRHPDSLTEDEQLLLKAILDRCPELQAASDQVHAFAGTMTELTGQDLPQRIAAARDAGLPGIASFAEGLEHDIDAVTNGLTMTWSSGSVEGRVNHIKMVKRQMFGRAGLPLLRKRVLLTARH